MSHSLQVAVVYQKLGYIVHRKVLLTVLKFRKSDMKGTDLFILHFINDDFSLQPHMGQSKPSVLTFTLYAEFVRMMAFFMAPFIMT